MVVTIAASQREDKVAALRGFTEEDLGRGFSVAERVNGFGPNGAAWPNVVRSDRDPQGKFVQEVHRRRALRGSVLLGFAQRAASRSTD
jgi:hypothetical protein